MGIKQDIGKILDSMYAFLDDQALLVSNTRVHCPSFELDLNTDETWLT